MKLKITEGLLRPATVLVALLAVVLVVVAFTPFTQTVPTLGSNVGDMVANCPSLTKADPAGSLPLGYDGGVTFECVGPAAAFVVSGGIALVTPTFILPAGNYTDFYIYPSSATLVSSGDSCTTLTGFQQLVTAVEESIPIGSWNYCAEVVNAQSTGLGTFDVDWDF